MTYQNNTQHEDIAMLLDYLKNKWDFFFGHSNHPKPLSDINHPKPKPEPNSAHSKPFCTKCGYYSKSKDQALQNLQKHIKNNVCHQPRANRLIHPDFQGTIAIVEKPFCTTCGFYSKSTTSSNQRLQKHIQSNSCHKPRANRLIHPDFVINKTTKHKHITNYLILSLSLIQKLGLTRIARLVECTPIIKKQLSDERKSKGTSEITAVSVSLQLDGPINVFTQTFNTFITTTNNRKS
jgi:Zn ribbon nucleic-acid-binding protein